MLAAVLLIIFLLVVIVGVPISFAMGFMTISAFTIGNGAMVIIPQKMFSGVYNFTYMCIPLFILASEIMSRCGLTMSIVKFCDTLVDIYGAVWHTSIFWQVCCLRESPDPLRRMLRDWVVSRWK